jgi:hypothetical protein
MASVDGIQVLQDVADLVLGRRQRARRPLAVAAERLDDTAAEPEPVEEQGRVGRRRRGVVVEVGVVAEHGGPGGRPARCRARRRLLRMATVATFAARTRGRVDRHVLGLALDGGGLDTWDRGRRRLVPAPGLPRLPLRLGLLGRGVEGPEVVEAVRLGDGVGRLDGDPLARPGAFQGRVPGLLRHAVG